MPLAIWLAVKGFGLGAFDAVKANPILQWILGALVMLLLLFLLWSAGVSHGKGVQKAADAKVAAAAQEKEDARWRAANQAAATQRAVDTVAVAVEKEARANAYANTPDSVPSAARRGLNCERLRSAGFDLAKVSGCGGPAAGAQAAAHR